jgi:hypothetical protein
MMIFIDSLAVRYRNKKKKKNHITSFGRNLFLSTCVYRLRGGITIRPEETRKRHRKDEEVGKGRGNMSTLGRSSCQNKKKKS